MPRPTAMATATLLAAAASSVLPAVANYLSAPPKPVPFATSASPLLGGPPPPPPPGMLGGIRPANQQANVPPSQPNTSPQQLKPLVGAKGIQSPTTSPLRILNGDASGVVNFKSTHGAYEAHLLIANQSGRVQKVTVAILLQDRRGAELKSAQVTGIPTGGFDVGPYATVVQPVEVRFILTPEDARAKSPLLGLLLPASGFLRFMATPDFGPSSNTCRPKQKNTPCQAQTNPGFLNQPIIIPEPPLPGATRVGLIVATSLGISAMVVAITCATLRKKKTPLLHRMGSATWSFGQSWGANVTIGAGLLGTFLTITAFPDHPRLLDKSSYTLLQVLFAAIIALAPFIYGVIRRDVQANLNGLATTDSQGYVIMFLLAGGLVLWGALGQVITLGVLIREFVLNDALATLTGVILESLVVLLGLILVIYGLRSLYTTAKDLSASAAVAVGTQPVLRLPTGMPLPAPLAPNIKPPMPNWSLL
jgi:hypothetical protein